MTRYRTIVVGTDFSDLAEAAIGSARAFAVRFEARRMHLVHVADADPEVDADALGRIADARRELEALPVFAPGGVELTREVRPGDPSEDLLAAAEDLKADLLVVASHGYGGFRRAILGSVTSDLVRRAHCPLLVVGGNRAVDHPLRRVLAAVDDSPVATTVLAHAVGVASAFGGALTAVNLFDAPTAIDAGDEPLPHYPTVDEQAQVDEGRRAAIRARAEGLPLEGLPFEIELIALDSPPRAILEAARVHAADLIVVGTSGRSAWTRLWAGSTANQVAAAAPCPVLVVPHDAPMPDGLEPSPAPEA